FQGLVQGTHCGGLLGHIKYQGAQGHEAAAVRFWKGCKGGGHSGRGERRDHPASRRASAAARVADRLWFVLRATGSSASSITASVPEASARRKASGNSSVRTTVSPCPP